LIEEQGKLPVALHIAVDKVGDNLFMSGSQSQGMFFAVGQSEQGFAKGNIPA
jgi:hypothetical protein